MIWAISIATFFGGFILSTLSYMVGKIVMAGAVADLRGRLLILECVIIGLSHHVDKSSALPEALLNQIELIGEDGLNGNGSDGETASVPSS